MQGSSEQSKKRVSASQNLVWKTRKIQYSSFWKKKIQ